MALHYLFHVLIELNGRRPGLHFTLQLCIGALVIGSVATFRHLVPVLPVREQPPGRRWLLRHYGIDRARQQRARRQSWDRQGRMRSRAG
jgi:hypothetical protein